MVPRIRRLRYVLLGPVLLLALLTGVAACVPQTSPPPPTPTAIPTLPGARPGISAIPTHTPTPIPPLKLPVVMAAGQAETATATATPIPPTETPPVTETPTVTTTFATEEAAAPTIPLPPLLVSMDPPPDMPWRDGPVILEFDRGLAPESVAGVHLSPPLSVEVAVDGPYLILTPRETPRPGTVYRLILDDRVQSADGQALPGLQEILLRVPARLEVTDIQPADGSTVPPDVPIQVIFNRPVVPLTPREAQAELPVPVTIEPPLSGRGEWVTTGVFRFVPEPGLVPGQAYTVTVADVVSLDGEPLAEPVVVHFRVAGPRVVSYRPSGGPVPLDTEVELAFNQPMDREATQAAFRLTEVESGRAITGTFAWEDDERRLRFRPGILLTPNTSYQVVLGAEAHAALGAAPLENPTRFSFATVALPGVAQTTPQHGADNVPPEDGVIIQFRGIISPTTLFPRVHIAPPVTDTTVYSYFSEYDNHLYLNWEKRSKTTYTITLDPGIQDVWGHATTRPHTFSFTTGMRKPWVSLDLPQFSHFIPFTRTFAPISYRGVDRLRVELYRLPVQEVLRLTGPDGWSLWRGYSPPDPGQNRIWARTFPVTPEPDRTRTFHAPLEDAEGHPLPPGVYLMQVVLPITQAQATEDTHARAILVVSRYNLAVKKTFQGESLAWLTDLATGEPVAGRPVTFMQLQPTENEEMWLRRVLARTETGPDGVATARLDLDTQRTWLPLFALSGEPGDPDFALASSEWNEGVEPWSFDLPLSYEAAPVRAIFYTERPIYRPGQTVYWKGIVRVLEEDRLQPPPEGTPVEVTIRDDRGNELLRTEVTTNRFGTVHGELALSPEAVTGFYSLEAVVRYPRQRPWYTGSSFQVAAYRPPEFQVAVRAETPDVVQGETITVVVEASYFSGGPLAQAPVTWRLLAEPFSFVWAQAPRQPRYFFTQVDLEDPDLSPYSSERLGVIHEGMGVTDAQGRLVITLTADLQGSPFSQRWTLDATVRSPTEQFVSGRTHVTVHRSRVYVGVAAERFVGGVGEPNTFHVVTVDPRGQRVGQVPLTAVVQRYTWHSVRVRAPEGFTYWESQVERTPVFTTTLTTDPSGEASFTWTPEAGGQYQVVVMGQDDAGNPATGSLFTWIWDRPDVYVPWRRENNNRLDLVADRERYAPGDVAQILVPSPFPGPVQALVSVERGGILSYTVQTLPGNSAVISVPIQEHYLPNVYVSVLVIKPATPEDPVPTLALGYVKLGVDPGSRALDIQIAPSVAQARPGQTVTYTLTVRGPDGRPVPDAELSAALVDKAVLSLSGMDIPSLLDAFYQEQPLGVTTGILLTINRDRLSQLISEGGKGGGGGGPGGVVELREQFADLAFWSPALVTDAQGRATFTVTLPDNLTTWTLVVRAITPDTWVGDADHDLVATKELLIRPALPRFFTAGDQVEIGALIQNTTDRDLGAVVLTAHVQGAHFLTPTVPITVTLGPQGRFRRTDPVAVPQDSTYVTVTFAARSPSTGLEDGVRLVLPVRRYQVRETVAGAGRVPPTGQVEAIRLPADLGDRGDLVVRLEASLAAGMLEGLNYLKHYPYECVEQTVSRFLPNLVTARTLQRLGVSMPDLEIDLAFQVGVGLQRLINRQNPDGGWGWWSNMESNRFISAYVLWALWQAHQAGSPVPSHVLDNGADFLVRGWTSPARVKEVWALNQMAFAHFVLAEMGRGDPGRMSTLYAERERLDLYARALLALAMDRVAREEGQTDPRVDALVDDLLAHARTSATATWWNETDVDWPNMGSDVRSTAMVLYALTRLRPEDPRLPGAVRWLMSVRKQGHWGTTQDNAWTILALTEWMATTGELQADYTWTANLNGRTLGQGHFTRDNLDTPVELRAQLVDLLREQPNLLVLQRDDGPGQLYYTTFLRTYQDAARVEAAHQGLSVARQFLHAQGPDAGQPTSQAQVGDLITVTVDLVAPSRVRYLVLEVPIPAGAEVVDTSLATTQAGLSGPGRTVAPYDKGRAWWYYWWLPDQVDIRDDKVVFFAQALRPGSYRYSFLIRAGLPGRYRVLPAQAELMYFPEIWGRSSGDTFTIVP